MATKKETTKKVPTIKSQTLKPGYIVALVLKEGTAPMRCYVGQVEDLDDRGIRLTLVDWFIGAFLHWDFFAPWESITAALVATPNHDVKNFGEAAGEFQLRCNHMGESEEAIQQAVTEYRKMSCSR
ncbi:MAG: hypothetical protein HY666_05815 [Chloroflexi bacterium]|nr:hypothetical protein [Chloroflexota bacterium]